MTASSAFQVPKTNSYYRQPKGRRPTISRGAEHETDSVPEKYRRGDRAGMPSGSIRVDVLLLAAGMGEATMTFSTPWLGRKRIAFVPLFRTNAAPPDQIPADWENVIFRRVVYDPRIEAKGADRSLRGWLRAASSGLADIDPIVLRMQTIDKQVVEANELDDKLRGQLRAQRVDAAVLV